jgi:hypothetical protein
VSDDPRFPNGARIVVGQVRRLATGRVEAELVWPSGARQRILVPQGHESDVAIAQLAEELAAAPRVIKGTDYGTHG